MHELCHLLFDDEVRAQRAARPAQRGRGTSDLRIERIGAAGAGAFAACFLAPAEGVRRAVAATEPTSEEAIRIVGSTFGVGRTVAINRLQHVFGLSDDQRQAMETRAGKQYEGRFEGDSIEEPLGYRGGALFTLVREALVAGKLGGTRARRLLGLTPADELPFADVDDDLRAPLVSPAERMRRCAEALLREHHPSSADLLAASAHLDGDTWHVAVIGGGIGARKPVDRGHLVLSRAGELLEDHVVPLGSGTPSARS